MTEEEVVRNTLIALDKSCPVCAGEEIDEVHDEGDPRRVCDEHLLACHKILNLVNNGFTGCHSCRQIINEIERRNL